QGFLNLAGILRSCRVARKLDGSAAPVYFGGAPVGQRGADRVRATTTQPRHPERRWAFSSPLPDRSQDPEREVPRSRPMKREKVRAAAWGIGATSVLAALIVLGSRNLAHFDAALVGYTFATLFATFGIAYRYAMWLQRPPTALYWKRGWQLFFRPGYLGP